MDGALVRRLLRLGLRDRVDLLENRLGLLRVIALFAALAVHLAHLHATRPSVSGRRVIMRSAWP